MLFFMPKHYAHFMPCGGIDSLSQQKKLHLVSIELLPQTQKLQLQIGATLSGHEL